MAYKVCEFLDADRHRANLHLIPVHSPLPVSGAKAQLPHGYIKVPVYTHLPLARLEIARRRFFFSRLSYPDPRIGNDVAEDNKLP